MSLSKLLIENLTNEQKKEVERLVREEFDKIQPEIDKKIREMIEDDKSQRYIHIQIADTLEKYHHTLWQRRGSWAGALRRQ